MPKAKPAIAKKTSTTAADAAHATATPRREIRLQPETERRLTALTAETGLSRNSVIILALNELYDVRIGRRGVPDPAAPRPPK